MAKSKSVAAPINNSKPAVVHVEPIKMSLQFVFSRETKGTYVFAEWPPEGNHLVGTLYVKKHAFGGGDIPSKVKMDLVIE